VLQSVSSPAGHGVDGSSADVTHPLLTGVEFAGPNEADVW